MPLSGENPTAERALQPARTTSLPSSGSRHELDSTWPNFLSLIDEDSRGAIEGLHVFAWRLFAARPPTVLKRLSHADREDRIADLVLSCCEWDFRRLRKYRDIGKPFAAWLTILLVNQTLDWLRSRKPFPEILEAKRAEEKDLPEPLPATIRTCIHRCLSRMGAKCQLYLACLADGMRPREIAVLVLLPEDNKRIADDLRYCLRKLRMMLIEEGLDPGKIVLE